MEQELQSQATPTENKDDERISGFEDRTQEMIKENVKSKNSWQTTSSWKLNNTLWNERWVHPDSKKLKTS